MKARSWLLCTITALLLPGCASWSAQRPADPEPQYFVAQPDRHLESSSGAVIMPMVTDVLSPNRNSRKGAAITTIVLHHTASASGALAIARYFQRRDAKVSAHYVVDRDGSVVRCVPDELRAWHAGPSSFAGVANVNDFSLGIEICNKGDGVDPYPQVQVAAVTQLVANLSKRYGIPMSRVTRHRDVALPQGIKIDPSNNFDFPGVVIAARGLLDGDQMTATHGGSGGP